MAFWDRFRPKWKHSNYHRNEEVRDVATSRVSKRLEEANDWIRKGNAFFDKRTIDDSKSALRCYDEAVKACPNSSDAWYRRAQVFVVWRQDSEAISCLDKATETDPQNMDAWICKSVMLKNPQDVLRCCGMVTRIDAKDARQWRAKGMSYERLSKPAEALVCYDKVIELENSNIDALNKKAKILLALGRKEEAEAISATVESIRAKKP